MANQPKKYKKFVATAATATLVASAIVPVASAASFTDVADTNSHAEAINALVEAGIIKGYEDGTFKPGATLTRGHVVKMLGKWVEAQGFEIPADYATKARFTDVAVDANDQELVKYAALVKDTGVFNGLADGSLNAKGDITRENMALTLDRAYKAVFGKTLVELAEGAEDLTVTDLATAKAEAREAIQALRNLGISTVDTFSPKNIVTRGQFASFLHRTINAAELTVKEVVAVNATTLNVTLTDNSTHVVTLDKALEANKATEVTFTIDGKQYTATVTFKVEAPTVMSVEIVNGVTVEVKFSEAVLKSDINNKVSIQGVTFDTATLSTDGKTLTLTSKDVIKVKDAAVVVEPIRTAANKLVKTAKYVSVVTYEDTVAPTVAEVVAKTNGKTASTVVVTLTEPATVGTVKLNGTEVKSADVKVEGKTITLSNVSVEAGKTHTVELFNLTDKAGNKTTKTAKTFEVTVDTAAPTATVEAAGDNAILVTFDKSMNVATVEAALANGVVKDELLTTVTSDTVKVVADSDDKQFLIKLDKATNIFANKDSRTFSVVLNGTMTDKLGNKFVATTKSVTLTKDATKPVATGYDIIVNENGEVESVVVEFNEALAAANAGAINFAAMTTVVNEQGKIDTTLDTLVSEKVEEGSKKVTFTFPTAKEITGKLAVTFNAGLVTDMALAANKSETFNMTLDFGTGVTDAEFKIVTDVTVTSGDVIKVTFPEAVKGGAVAGSATDLANYTLDGKALPAGTTITIDDNNLVATITLPKGAVAADNKVALFTVSNVKNIAGTKTVKAYEQTIHVLDTVAPVLTSAVVLDGTTIELTFDENVQIAKSDATSSFVVKVGDQTIATSVTATAVTSFDNKVKLTFASELNLKETITVETVATGAAITDKSENKNVLKDAVKVTVTPKQ